MVQSLDPLLCGALVVTRVLSYIEIDLPQVSTPCFAGRWSSL